MKLQQVAALLNCTVEQARAQYLANARQMHGFANTAERKGLYLGRTATAWKADAERYERIAKGQE